MPNIALPISGVYETVTRPVVYSAIRSMMSATGIDEDTPIFFPGENKQAILKGSKLEEVAIDNSFQSTDKVTISVEEQYVSQQLLADPVKRRQNVLIFNDPVLGIHIKPIYTTTEVTITTTFRASSRTVAENWMNNLKNIVRLGKESYLMELNYHYPVPKAFLIILLHLAQLRENQGGYGETANQYFKEKFSENVTTKSTQAGSKGSIATNERQINVEGWFDFEGLPDKPEPNDSRSTYSFSFPFKFVYEKVTSCNFEYPIIVHNQLVDQKFRNTDPKYIPEQHSAVRPASGYNFSQIRQVDNWREARPGYSIPHWDDWQARIELPNTMDLLRIAMLVDPNDPTNITNLTELGDYSFSENLLPFLYENYDKLTNYHRSPILVILYLDGNPLDFDSINIDSDLNITSRIDMDIRKPYHLRVALNLDLFRLTTQARTAFRSNGLLLTEFYISVAQWFGIPLEQAPLIMDNGVVSNGEFIRIAQLIKDRLKPYRRKPNYHQKTVGQYLITTKRIEDN